MDEDEGGNHPVRGGRVGSTVFIKQFNGPVAHDHLHRFKFRVKYRDCIIKTGWFSFIRSNQFENAYALRWTNK